MSTLVENVAKVQAAHSALKEAIAAKGVTVPDGTKLTGMPALVREIPEPSPVGWGRPLDWTRIDLIDIGQTDPDVCYFIVRKPSDTVNHGFCLTASTADKNQWMMEQVSVSADGSSVETIPGTEQAANSGSYIDFAFPDSDPAGTTYAVRVHSPQASSFSLSLAAPSSASTEAIYYISSVILEAIVHQTANAYLSFGSPRFDYCGPRHIVYTGCPKGQMGNFAKITDNLHLVEFRKGSRLNLVNGINPCFQCKSTVLEMDDDAQIFMDVAATYSGDGAFIMPDSRGNIDHLDRFIDKATENLVDWSSFKGGSCFTGRTSLTSLTLPAGFGQNATTLANCFNGCTALLSITFPEGFGQNTTNLSNCFAGCRSLSYLELPAGFGQNATTLNNCFLGCTSLVSLALPDGFGKNVTSTSGFLSQDIALTHITGNPNFKTSLNLSPCTRLTHDSLMVVINGLPEVTTSQTLQLGSVNLSKLTDDEKKVATDKGWTLS